MKIAHARHEALSGDERVSALMDGELSDEEAASMLSELKSDEVFMRHWRDYHLIADAMRGRPQLSADFEARLSARLAQEPTVLAPIMKRHWKPGSLALSVAASFSAVAIVALVVMQAPAEQSINARQLGSVARLAAVPKGNAAGVNEYLVAHQEFSPSTAMQGYAYSSYNIASRDAAR
jgi:sigma-E factor negative regulatory protein RseA